MYLRHLALSEFRNWSAVDVEFGSGPSVLLGANGQGKTNLVEALGYLATLASHRVATDAALIRHGADAAVIRAAVLSAGRELRAEVALHTGRANAARLGGSVLPRTRDLLGAVRVVTFAPEDLAIVRGDPSERRRFLDELVVARAPRLAGVRADYERVLRQRASLLRSAGAARRGNAAALGTLQVWDEQLATLGAQLVAARLATLARLRGPAVEAYAQVAPSAAPLQLGYLTGLTEQLDGPLREADPPDEPALRAALLARIETLRGAELDRGVNLVGPHRDDVELRIGALPVRGYASHGEGWSVALALRLGCFAVLSAQFASGGEPILVLDDVFAELDAGRRAQLAKAATGAEQVLITAAVPADVPPELVAARYAVAEGTVRRVG